MSITVDKIKVEGNSIFIRSNPTIGVIALTSFLDDATGEDLTHIFTKSFRYSRNGIIFSEWFPLTPINITTITVSAKDTLIIELQYIKNQPEGDNALSVNVADIGATEVASVSGYYFNNSIFKAYFESDNLEVLNWQINVLDKLFQKGLLPSYIDRFNEFENPDDFIEFWRSVTKFFAYYVVYARKFQKFYESEVLLSEYLEQKGIAISPLNELNELNHLMEKFYKEIANRGTRHITDRISNSIDIDGELLRLIHYNKFVDEFIFNLYKPEHFGWNLGNSSPLYRGMRINDNANKFYEPQVDVDDIDSYPITAEDSEVVTDPNHHTVLQITNGGISNEGLDSVGLEKFKIVVDPFLDYELFFLIKLENLDAEVPALLTVGFDAYDKDENIVSLKSYSDGANSNLFLQDTGLQRDDKYIGVSLFLYSKMKPGFPTDLTSINIGHDLRLVDTVTHVIPRITCTEGRMNLYNMRLTPMRTSYSRGFLDTKNFISAWIKNNNNELDILGIKQFTRRYLIPYNSNIAMVNISDESDYSEEFITLP